MKLLYLEPHRSRWDHRWSRGVAAKNLRRI